MKERRKGKYERGEGGEEMASFTLFSTLETTFSLYSNTIKCKSKFCRHLKPQPYRYRCSGSSSLNHSFNSLRSLIGYDGRIVKSRRSRRFWAVCYTAPLTACNLQWISTVSSVVLMLARGTAVQKSFIVPLFALQAPPSVIAWINGRYGVWSAFLALLVRLFYIPGELELPFLAVLLVMVAPYEAMKLRDTKEGAVISLLIAVYLAFQHFSRASLQKAFDQVSIVATLAVICITVASLLLLI